MRSEPLVSIMILGWNNYDDVIGCLKSLKKISYVNYNVMLVDNGSRESEFNKLVTWLKESNSHHLTIKDNYLEIKKLSKPGVILIAKNDKNYGFTGGSNIGERLTWKVCDPKYMLLLNGDTLVTKNFLVNLVSICEQDKKIGSAQSVLLRFDKKTVDSLGLEMCGYRIFDVGGGQDSSIMNNYEPVREIFGACGASAIYRANLIKKIGLFDDGLFATFEDFDLAWRIRLAGFRSVLVKDSVVYHRGGVSRARGDHVMFDMRSYLAAKNSLVMFNRYYPINIRIISTSLVRIGVGLISAFKNHRTREYVSIILKFPKERKNVAKNKLLKEIRKRWIM